MNGRLENVQKNAAEEHEQIQDRQKWNLLMEAKDVLDHLLSQRAAIFKNALVLSLF